MRLVIPSLLVTLLASAGAFAQDVAAVVGQPAPAFTLPDTNGTQHSLSDFAGRVVVLEWTNPGCPFVVRHYQQGTMAALVEEHDGIVWLSVNSTNPDHRDHALVAGGNAGQTWPTLVDPAGTVGHLYGARTTPHMYVIAADGTLAYAGAIDNDPRGQMDRSSADYVNYVDQALDALAAGPPPTTTSSEPYGCSVKYPQ